ncbi:MAG: hypothetical protein ACP5P3_02725 [Ignavibacteria bacterium]
MKKIGWIIILSLIIVSQAFPQKNYEFIGALGGGMSIPLGKLSEEYKLGYNVNLNYGLMFSTVTGMNISFVYNSYTADFPGYYRGGKLEVSAVNLNFLLGKMNPKDRFNFYGYAGIGFSIYDVGSLSFIDQSTGNMIYRDPIPMETKFGWNTGMCGVINLSRSFGLYADISYDFYFYYDRVSEDTELRSHIPFKAGIFFALF